MAFDRFGQGGGLDEWAHKIHDIMEEMQNRNFVHFRDSKTWQPATNVYETPEAYHICVELAGVDAERVEVDCVGQTRVTISGSRAQPRPQGVERALSVHAMEIDEGRFFREIDLPEAIDTDRVEAMYSEGYLWITIPRKTTK